MKFQTLHRTFSNKESPGLEGVVQRNILQTRQIDLLEAIICLLGEKLLKKILTLKIQDNFLYLILIINLIPKMMRKPPYLLYKNIKFVQNMYNNQLFV